MILDPAIAVLLLLALSVVQISSDSCKCFPSQSFPSGLRVDCSTKGLRKVPKFPPDTTELDLRRNGLSTVPSGHFDMLRNLRVVHLSHNPFHCGCNIRYLRAWLLKNKAVTTVAPTCASPASLAGRAIVDLSNADFSDCVQARCKGIPYNVTVGLMLCALIGLLFWCFRLAKDLTFILGIGERHGGLAAESLRPLTPKHRLRRKSLGAISLSQRNDELERPLLNMEILPQIIDTLHRQHNIKIKEI